MTGTNVAFIAIDDLFAYTQFRDSFGVAIETPNLDRLMAQSVNFENAYASVAICAPSRAATLTGKTAFETGVHDNFTSLFDAVDIETTLPAQIRDNGYFATAAGKVFHSRGVNPVEQRAYSEGLPQIRNTLTDERTPTDSGLRWAYQGPDEDFSDYDVAQFGIDFLDRAPDDQPFLLNLGFDHPHTPYFNPARYFDLYPLDEIQVPTDWVNGDLSDVPAFAQQFVSQTRGEEPYTGQDTWKAKVQGYLASVTHMDHEVGRFLDALAGSDHASNTAVVIYSDHGYQLGAKDHPVKFTLWEESAKAPLMIYHPDHTVGKTVSTPVSLMDLMPTLLELTGTPDPGDLNGQSLLSFVTGDGADYIEKPALTMMYGSFAIRSGDFRYIRYQDGSQELYNVVQDPAQITNLAVDPAFATLAADLRLSLLASAREAGAIIDETVDVLTGTEGADNGVASVQNSQIALGDGNDNYMVWENTTQIIETANGGYDTVYYIGTATYVLPDNIERFYATQSSNITKVVKAQGNDQDNEFHSGYFSADFDGGGGNDVFYGGGWINHTFHGGSGNDRLYGARFADILYGGNDLDFIDGGNKNDLIFGGEARDTLIGNYGNDIIHGDAGDDDLFGGQNDDSLNGGLGDDVLTGGNGNDRLQGGEGQDHLLTNGGSDSANGGAGDDTLTSQAGRDLLIGGTGNDVYVIETGAGDRVIDETTSSEVDEIRFLAADFTTTTVYGIADAILLDAGHGRTLWIEGAATNPDDTVVFADGVKTLAFLQRDAVRLSEPPAGFGDETIVATGYDDIILGLLGDDHVTAKGGDDTIFGGQGDDTLGGNAGDDVVFGGAGNDVLNTANGADTLDGGSGDDTLLGGKDGDRYVYRLGDGSDTIEDGGFGAGDALTILQALEADVQQTIDGNDLVLTFPDGGTLRIVDQYRDKGRIEQITFSADDTPTEPDLDMPEPVQPTGTFQGTNGNDRLFGTNGDDTLTDGAGNDNLYGRGGSDLFVMVADNDADSIKDFDPAEDQIDVSAWGVSAFDDLQISMHVSGKTIIRFGSELLSVNTVAPVSSTEEFSQQHFIFAEVGPTPPTPPVDLAETITGTSGNDKLIGNAADNTLLDGAGRDNLYGKEGSDLFILTFDGVSDAIKDFDVSQDRIDVSVWGATGIGDLTLTTHSTGKTIVRFEREVLSVNDGKWTLPASDLDSSHFVFAEASTKTLTGTDQNDRIIGTSAAEFILDGAGNDNLYGRAGADTFVLSKDSDADSIKDFQDGLDRIDISAWGVNDITDLEISTHSTGKTIIRHLDEVLSVNDGYWTLASERFSADDFVFG